MNKVMVKGNLTYFIEHPGLGPGYLEGDWIS